MIGFHTSIKSDIEGSAESVPDMNEFTAQRLREDDGLAQERVVRGALLSHPAYCQNAHGV